MTPTEPLPLHHSWAMADQAVRLDLGRLHEREAFVTDGPGSAIPTSAARDALYGWWSCDLATNRLDWSPEIHRLFGLRAEGTGPERCVPLALYEERSRAAMERLRAHAIRHRRGFTLDIAIRPVDAARRWLRLVAAPVVDGARVVRLHGWKADVSDLYRGG